MELKRALSAYLKTPLCLGSLAASLAAGLGAAALSGYSLFLGLGGGIVFWAALGLALIQTGAGARAIVAQTEAEEKAANLARIEEASRFLERIKVIRIADPEVAKAQAYLVQTAGEYLDACRAASSRSPEADARIADSLDTIDLYLKELDEGSTERRFGLEDADAFPEAKRRVLEVLQGNARLIREERLKVSGGLPPVQRMAIKEELQ
jgi:hypothetical protein